MLSQEADNNDDGHNYYEEISTSNLLTSASPSSPKLDEEEEAIRSDLRSYAAGIAKCGSFFFCIEVMSIFMSCCFLYFRACKSDDILPHSIEMVYGILAVLSVKSITCHMLRRLLNYLLKVGLDSLKLRYVSRRHRQNPDYGQGEYTSVERRVLRWKIEYMYMEIVLWISPYLLGLSIIGVFFIFDPNPTFIHYSFEWEHHLFVGLVAAGGLYLAANVTYLLLLLTIMLKHAFTPSQE